jgi:putative hydrolase of the HAD superfamily
MERQFSDVRSIIFDIDQTLSDFKMWKLGSTDAAIDKLRKSGVKMGKDDLRALFRQVYDKEGWENQNVFDIILPMVDDDSKVKMSYKKLSEMITAYRETKRRLLKPYPDVPRTLKELSKRGYRLAVASDAPKLQAWTRLWDIRVGEYFDEDNVITPEDTGRRKKPDKAAFELAAKALGGKYSEILMVGDNCELDIAGAKKLGMRTAWAKYGNVFPQDTCDPYQKADVILNKGLSELLKYLPKKVV